MWRRDFHGTHPGIYFKKWTGLIPKHFSGFLFVFDWLYFIQWLLSILSIDHLLRPLYMVVDAISTNIDKVLSINPRADVIVFKDFNCHRKDWLNYSGGTCRFGKLFYSFSISNKLTQIVNFPARIPPLWFLVILFRIYLYTLTLDFVM